jgi:hypothetical protein
MRGEGRVRGGGGRLVGGLVSEREGVSHGKGRFYMTKDLVCEVPS